MPDPTHLSGLSDAEVAAFRASGEFDEQWYLNEYPDVAKSGIDPARHYLWIGRKLGRRAQPTADADSSSPNSTKLRQDILDHCKDDQVHMLILQQLTKEARSAIMSSGLFDEEFYRKTCDGEIHFEQDLLYDLIYWYFKGDMRDPSPLFSVEYYKELNKDAAALHPLCHYALYGKKEGRAAYSPKKVNAFLAKAIENKLATIDEILAGYNNIKILYWSDGNFFMTDIAKYTCSYLKNRGYNVTLGTDLPAKEKDVLNIITAPHEFCVHGPGKSWSDNDLARSAYIATEQWHTTWFMLSEPFLMKTQVGVLDMNPSSACGLAELGVKSAFLPLLPLKGSCFDIPVEPIKEQTKRYKFLEPLTYSESITERSYDVLFVGVLNDRRASILARLAPVLSKYKVFIHGPRFTRPVKKGDPDMLSHSEFVQLARNSKILLNIHQGDSHYLEWQRIFLVGAMEGCVTVSEPNTPNNFMVPGRNFIEADSNRLGEVIDFLLGTEQGAKCLQEIADVNASLRDSIMRGEEFA